MSLAYGQHIFYHHLLPKHNLTPLINLSGRLVWPSVLLLFCLILLVIVKLSSYSKIIKIVQSTFSVQALQKLEREEYSPLKFSSIVLNLLFIINLSFLAYKINTIYRFILVESAHLWQFLFFTLVVLFIFLFKSLVNAALAHFTNEKKVVADYTTSASLINQTFGLLLFPWIILLELSSFNPLIFISGALIVLAISLLFKWYRGVIIGLIEERIGLLQIFTYFCGLEILPGIVLVKYIIETF